MANVAFIGTGLLGSGMVEAMLRRGDAVTVWNRTESKAPALEQFGAQVASSPVDAVADAERVHLTLPDDDVVDGVTARMVPGLRAGTVMIDHSTTAPGRTEQRVMQMAHDGIGFRHAPVFMSPQMGARRGWNHDGSRAAGDLRPRARCAGEDDRGSLISGGARKTSGVVQAQGR